jgi:hypothetical protein
LTIRATPLDKTTDLQSSDMFAQEHADGFRLGFRGPGLQWLVTVRMDGAKGDACSSVEIGFIQTIHTANSLVTWRGADGRRTRWAWDLPVPSRDAQGIGPGIWYSLPSATVASCGASIPVRFFDSPILAGAPSQGQPIQDVAIPWNDPRTRARLTLESAYWELGLVTWLAIFDNVARQPKILRTAQWGFKAFFRFDASQPLGSRGTPSAQNSVRTPKDVSEIGLGQVGTVQPILEGQAANTRVRVREFVG